MFNFPFLPIQGPPREGVPQPVRVPPRGGGGGGAAQRDGGQAHGGGRGREEGHQGRGLVRGLGCRRRYCFENMLKDVVMQLIRIAL